MHVSFMAIAIGLFVLVDAIVMVFVLKRVLRMSTLANGRIDLRQLREFTKCIEQTTEEHLRTNWSGDPTTLPSVLEALVGQLSTRQTDFGMTLERELIKRSVAQVVRARRLVPERTLREAMREVA